MLRMPHALAVSLLLTTLGIAAQACDSKQPSTQASADTTEATAQAKNSAESASKEPVESASRPMMVEFSRDYCTPCQIMKPWVDEIADENPNVDVLTLNVDRKKYEHIGSFFKITAVPSLIFVGADGKIVRRREGLAKKEQMTKSLKELGWAP